ncbi:uncharacterized protein LOC127878352 [Dreissena polymorpha]|uniref:uncharacterized protein LOC127878352 n=1 Tax=Dreissena polymorpha TaxID=45954 RepID=UPI002263C9CA|nr:uncharacterized protein LOC127878352 [Dreissena polymorpha]
MEGNGLLSLFTSNGLLSLFTSNGLLSLFTGNGLLSLFTGYGLMSLFTAVTPQSQEGHGYDQRYHPNYAPVGSVIQSSSSVVVVNQPAQNTMCVMQPRPPDYTGLAFFSCLCCAWPLGLVAIILAIQAKSLAYNGHYNDAKRRSNVALGFIIASVIVCIACIVAVVTVVLCTGIIQSDEHA